jgi:hypothetical protein
MSTISRFDGPIWEDQRLVFIPENLDKKGAERLAVKITRYWAKHGKNVKCRVIPMIDTAGSGSIWAVRSDMIGALPR